MAGGRCLAGSTREKREKVTIERNREGAWVIYALGGEGYLVTRSYYGYSKREAVRLFRQYMREGESK